MSVRRDHLPWRLAKQSALVTNTPSSHRPTPPAEVPPALPEGSGAGGSPAAGAGCGGDARGGRKGGLGDRGGAGDGRRGPRPARPAGEEEGAHQEKHQRHDFAELWVDLQVLYAC